MGTATERREIDYRRDMRKLHADSISYAIWSEIRDLIPQDIEREVFERIFSTIHTNGVLLIRDSERANLGLEPCDEKGWTPSERVKFEQDRIAAMSEMASFVVRVNSPE